MYCLEFVGEDDPFAALEAGRAAATDVSVLAPGIGLATAVDPDAIRRLALTRRACDVVGYTDATVEAARELLAAAPIDREGSVAVRARDIRSTAGVDTQRIERELGSVLVDRGFSVDLDDPDHVLRALVSRGAIGRDPAYDPDSILDPTATGTVAVDDDAEDADRCVLGWTVAESERSYGGRAPTDRPFFQPGSMDPLLARALVNIGGGAPGRTVFDPMCGTGGLLLEAAMVDARALGADAQSKMVQGARTNLGDAVPEGDWAVCRGDARQPPVRDGAVDTVVFDAPYERQSAVAGESLDALVRGALAAARSLAPRAVVVADRSWVDAARDAGWAVDCVHRRRVHRSLVRQIHVLVDPSSSGKGSSLTAVDRDSTRSG